MGRMLVKIIVIGLSAVVCLLFFTLYGLKYLAQKPPEFYTQIISVEETTPSAQVHEQAQSLEKDFMQLRNDLTNDPEWSIRLTDDTINAWLAENSLQSLSAEIPPEVSDLRIKFELERIRIAFRWRGRPVQSVVSITLRPEILATNEIQIGIESIQAGVLPIGLSRLKEVIEDAIPTDGEQVQWVQSASVPTLKLKISPKLEKRLIELEKATILDNEIRLSGKSRKNKK
ncbi:MAG: hypothetical protein ACKO85_19285 [Isosphaeraceae bacterium]